MSGLSETWLIKECGHRHWFLLAHAAGLPMPDFHDPAGEPIYAVFLAVSVREGAIDTVHGHDRLTFASRLARVSRTQHEPAQCSVAEIGEIVLTSALVRQRSVAAQMRHAQGRVRQRRRGGAFPGQALEFAGSNETVHAALMIRWRLR